MFLLCLVRVALLDMRAIHEYQWKAHMHVDIVVLYRTWRTCRFTYRALTKGRYGASLLALPLVAEYEAAAGSSRTRNNASLTLESRVVARAGPCRTLRGWRQAIRGERDTVFLSRSACLSVSSNFQCCGGRSTDPKATSS